MSIISLIMRLSWICATLAGQTQPARDPIDAHQLTMEGWKLSAEEVKKLENQVKTDPNDLADRTRLLGYYFRQDFPNHQFAQARLGHVLWIIAHRPESQIAGLPA